MRGASLATLVDIYQQAIVLCYRGSAAYPRDINEIVLLSGNDEKVDLPGAKEVLANGRLA